MRPTWAVLTMMLMLGTMTACAGTGQPVSIAASEGSVPESAFRPDSAVSESFPTTAADKKAVLVASFGTSYNESRAATIGAIENDIADAFPDFEVRRAFTSQIIINKLKSRDNEQIDNVEEAMNRLVADGIKILVVQPTFIMSGQEYSEMVRAVMPFKDKFDALSIGVPLLTSDSDYQELSAAITAATWEQHNLFKAAVVFMGHGTEHSANVAYKKLADTLKAMENAQRYYIGTVEATPSLADVIAEVGRTDATRVVLLPLMIVAGDHANNDLAGDGEDSWKTQFKNAGYEVECVIKGLGEYSEVRMMFIEHTQDAIYKLEK